jgi:carbonic anhydrase/acetyltransferase-like protein (isoleucine patch superfamily)
MPEITWNDRLQQRVERRLQLARGWWVRLRGARVGARFGLGRQVRVLYPRCLWAGDDVTIEEYAYLHCLSARGVRFGSYSSVGRNLWLSCGRSSASPGYFELGDYSFIGPNAVMGAGGPIVIGSHVQIGPNVILVAENHMFSDPTRLIDEQGVSHEGICIEEDCWIGAGVTIVDGVRIGRGSVVGAGAVVSRSIPRYSVAIGVPARVVRSRTAAGDGSAAP